MTAAAGETAGLSHRLISLLIIIVSAVLVAADGLLFAAAEHIPAWHGVYCIWMTAITVGGDVGPTGWGYACLAFAPVPLLAVAFSLLTSGLAELHIRRAKREIMTHVESRLRHHLGNPPDGGTP